MTAEPDVMTWFPRREDYEVVQVVQLDETNEEKLARLLETIEVSQSNIKEVVDKDTLGLEEKIFRILDLKQDLQELTDLHKELEKSPEAASCAADLKKAKVGLINLQAYMNQVDCIEFAAAINNQYLFNVGSREGFGPWIAEAEKRIICRDEKPKAYEEVNSFEQNACAFLKEVVKANKMLQRVQQAAEGIKGNVVVQEEMSKLSERYYVLCKKADQRVKNLQHLMIEWQRLDEILAPTDPKDMDDLQTKQFLVFLRTYAAYFS